MKNFRFQIYRYVLLCSFCLVMISHEHFGGFYLLYVLMALPHGNLYAVLALLGAGGLFLPLTISHAKWAERLEPAVRIAGTLALLLSLFVFFYRDASGYREETLGEAITQVSVGFVGAVAFLFMALNLRRMGLPKPGKG